MENNEIQVNDKRFTEEVVDVVPVQQDNSLSMVQTAMEKGYTPEFIEKMMDLSERNEANIAKKAYVRAMAEFKRNPPDIYKDKENKQFKSMYSSISAIVNPAIPVLSKYGLSHNWVYPKREDDLIEVECVLTHEMGHSESVSMIAPKDTSGGNSKNAIQQIKSTHTYLKIATFEAVTGLVSKEANLDDDGNSAGEQDESISEHEVNQITDMINEIGMKEEKFVKLFDVSEVSQIPAKRFNEAMNALKDALKKKTGGAK